MNYPLTPDQWKAKYKITWPEADLMMAMFKYLYHLNQYSDRQLNKEISRLYKYLKLRKK